MQCTIYHSPFTLRSLFAVHSKRKTANLLKTVNGKLIIGATGGSD